MGLFDKNSALSALGGLFQSYTGVSLTPAGTSPVQATLPATRTGTPAQDPISGAGANGMVTSVKGSSLFSGNSAITPILIIVGSIVAVAAIVMIARR